MEGLPATNRWFLFKKKNKYTEMLQQEQNRNKTKVMPAIAKFKLLECANNNEFVIIIVHKRRERKNTQTTNTKTMAVKRFTYRKQRSRRVACL